MFKADDLTSSNNYKDITKQWEDLAKTNFDKKASVNIAKVGDTFDYNGISYNVDDKNVVIKPNKEEMKFAEWMANKFNNNIDILPRVNKPKGIQTSDFLFRGEYWDLKTVTGKSGQTISRTVIKKKEQSINFIFDFGKSNLTWDEINKQIASTYNHRNAKSLNKLLIKKGDEYLVVKKMK
ncbi:MAG: hypothetical protein ACK5G7_01270 [Erysipelotrichaceae bacterium]